MKYLVDSNACIVCLRGKNPLVTARFALHPPADVVVCSVVRAELLLGVERSGRPANRVQVATFIGAFPTLPFDDVAAEVYARIRYDLETRGLPIGANDLLIASIALASNLTLVTHNTREFSRVPGLALDDWEIP